MSMADYVTAAMGKAVYTALPDGSYEAYVPVMSGTKVQRKSREECEKALQPIVEEWLRRTFGEHK